MSSQTIHLLATAPVPDGMVEEAAGRGVVLEVTPFIDCTFVAEGLDMERLLSQPLTVVFTSANAVDAVRKQLKGILPKWKIYCTSGATLDSVIGLFGEEAVVGKAVSAKKLAAVIGDRETGNRTEMVFFCGDQRRGELPSLGLTEMIVYRTLLTPNVVARNYDGIVFFSPSAVESFFSVNNIPAGTPLFAIGDTTGSAIRAACANPVFTSRAPDKAVVIREMIDYFLFKA